MVGRGLRVLQIHDDMRCGDGSMFALPETINVDFVSLLRTRLFNFSLSSQLCPNLARNRLGGGQKRLQHVLFRVETKIIISYYIMCVCVYVLCVLH